MTEILNPSKTCAITGHRILDDDIDKERIKDKFLYLIEKGYDTFLNGMALGFDSLTFKILEELRREYNIKIIACIPCVNQDLKFTTEQKTEYKKMVESADGKIILSEKYTPYCMNKRNRFMVDNSSCLLAYLKEKRGGTYNTVSYAEKKGIEIINV